METYTGYGLERAFSSKEMLKLVPNSKFVVYQRLKHIKTLDQLFGKKRIVLLLYQTFSEQNGHWTCLIKDAGGVKNRIEFFDPYGMKEDGEFRYIAKGLRARTNAKRPELSRLMITAPRKYTFEYSNAKIQHFSNSIATCGPHVIVRCRFRDMPNTAYVHKLRDAARKSHMTTDQLVSATAEAMLGRLRKLR